LVTARQLQADTIILGPPRPQKGLSGIFGGSTIQKIIKQSSSTVIIADAISPASPPFFTDQDELNPILLAEIDLFLTDTWVHHLNWFSQTAHGLLDASAQYDPHDETSCHFGTWLSRLPQSSHWAKLTTMVAESHRKFHHAVMQMAEMAENEDLPSMVKLYHEKAMPLSIDFKKGIQEISRQLNVKHKKTSESKRP
jgi:hypothetical protein